MSDLAIDDVKITSGSCNSPGKHKNREDNIIRLCSDIPCNCCDHMSIQPGTCFFFFIILLNVNLSEGNFFPHFIFVLFSQNGSRSYAPYIIILFKDDFFIYLTDFRFISRTLVKTICQIRFWYSGHGFLHQ